MTTTSSSKTLKAGFFVGGLLATCLLMAGVSSLLEYALRFSSGIGPLYSFVQLPIYLLISAVVALIVLGFAKVKRLSAPSSSQYAALGTACDLASAFQLATPWVPEIPAILVTTGVAIGIALFLWTQMGDRAGA